MVWTVFGFVVVARFLLGPMHFDGRQGPGFGPFGGPAAQQRMMRRNPARIPSAAAPLNLPTNLWRVHIEVAPADVRKLQGYFWNGWGGGGGGGERPEVKVTVREGGVTYTNVALHLKGSAGSFRPFDDKPALTLNFGKHAKGQSFHGYPKLSLNNSVQDDTFLCEAISRELFEASGVPAPRADHATVVLNGRDLGLYVMTEGWGKPFLRRHFSDVRGNLYDGGFLRDIGDPLEVTSGDDQDDRAMLDRLESAAQVADRAKRWERLNEVLDMDRFLSLLAMEVMTCHWDGYALNRNNYRVFHDRTTDRLVFMPHGLDQMFGINRSSPTAPIQPAMQGLVARAVMGTTEGRRGYLDRVALLRTNVFVEERVVGRVRELSARIRPTLAAYSEGWAASHDRDVEFLCRRISERAHSITEQLSAPPREIQFDAQGVARLTSWAPRRTDGGATQFERTQRDGIPVLRGQVVGGGGQGSWRTGAELPAGRYVFEGRARTTGMGGNGGVCLRISGQRRAWTRSRDDEWIELKFPVTIDEVIGEVELVCEFGGAAGEAWFDLASLRLVRVGE
jgi:spore coat protein H